MATVHITQEDANKLSDTSRTLIEHMDIVRANGIDPTETIVIDRHNLIIVGKRLED